jgi:regulator of replication initiation timing
MKHPTSHRPIYPEPTLRDVFDDVDRVHQRLDTVLNELEQIKQTLERLASSVAEVQTSVDERD